MALIVSRFHGSARETIRRNVATTAIGPSPRTSRGLSLIEFMVAVAIILIIASISIPSLLRSRRPPNEVSAVVSLRVMNSACQSQIYAVIYGAGFQETHADLGSARSTGGERGDGRTCEPDR